MAITINGSGTVTGLVVGGLPDGTVDADTLATDSVTAVKIPDTVEADLKSGRKNLIINGAMQVAQRGTSFTSFSGDTFTVDRWFTSNGGAVAGDTLSQQSFTPGQTNVPGEPESFFRFSAGATVNNRVWGQRIEDVRSGAGQTLTLSFYGKASIAHSLTIELLQNFGSGGSSAVVFGTTGYNLTTSWQKFTFDITVPAITGKTVGAGSYIELLLIRSLGASSVDIDIANVQLEVGSQATDFEHRSYGEELALCQRYYYKWDASSNPHLNICMGRAISSTKSRGVVDYPVTMRNTPSINSSGSFRSVDTAANTGVTVSISRASKFNTYINFDGTSGDNLTAGAVVEMGANNDTSAWIAWDAEL